MATIIGGRVVSVEVKRDKLEPVQGLAINVSIEEVAAEKDEMTVKYTLTVTYNENVGKMKIGGLVMLREDAKRAKEITKEWKDKKKLPDEFAEVLMNGITYACAVNGTFFSQPLGLNAPVMLMPVRIGKGPVPPGAVTGQTDKAA